MKYTSKIYFSLFLLFSSALYTICINFQTSGIRASSSYIRATSLKNIDSSLREESNPILPIEANKSNRKGETYDYEKFWGLFDGIFCIDTFWDQNRAKHSRKQMEKFGLLNRVTFVNATQRDKGHIGTWLSHKGIAEMALKQNLSLVVIFEDDFVFMRSFGRRIKSIFQNVKNFSDRKSDWEFLYLSHNPSAIKCTDFPGIVNVRSWGFLSYIVGKRGLEKISSSIPPHAFSNTVDGLGYTSSEAYAIYPMIVKHRLVYSYTGGRMRQKMELKNWCKWERRLYHRANSSQCAGKFAFCINELLSKCIIACDRRRSLYHLDEYTRGLLND